MLTRGDGRGRLFSRQVLYSQCNGFLHEGSLCLASQRGSGRSWRKGGAEARAQTPSWHHEPDQAGPEGRAGLPLPCGNQQRALRQVEGVDPFLLSVQTARGLLFPSVGCTPLREIRPCCPALQISGSSLWRQVHTCRCWDPLAPDGSSGRRLFHSSVATLVSHMAQVAESLAQVLAWRGVRGGCSP